MPNYLTGISEYTTEELVNELLKRKGVEQYTVAPHTDFSINIDENWDGHTDGCVMEGSARILIVTD